MHPFTSSSRQDPPNTPRRPATIAELADRALDGLWDETKELKHYLVAAERYRRDGKEYVKQGDLESGFVEFAKAATLVLEKLPTHREYHTLLTYAQRHNLGLNGQDILDHLSDLKPTLLKRHERWMKLHPSGERTPKDPQSQTYGNELSELNQQHSQRQPERRHEERRVRGKERIHQRDIQEQNRVAEGDMTGHNEETQILGAEDRERQWTMIHASSAPLDRKKESAAVGAARDAVDQPQSAGVDYTLPRPTNGGHSRTPVPDPRQQRNNYHRYQQQQEEMRQREEEIMRKREQKRRQEQDWIARRQQEVDEAARAVRHDIAINNTSLTVDHTPSSLSTMLERMGEFHETDQIFHPHASNPLDQNLKGFSDNGGGTGGIAESISNFGKWREGDEECGGTGWVDSDNKTGPKPPWSYTMTESNGTAFFPIQHAIFNGKSNIDWDFSMSQNESISSLLDWIQTTEHILGESGLRKFLHCGKRGALFTNANYHPEQDLQQPDFDWITFDDLQKTQDNIIEESIISYDPATQVVIFVLLPPDMENTVAMWVRKIDVPNSVQLSLQSEIQSALYQLGDQKAQLHDFAGAESTKNMVEDLLKTPLERLQLPEVSADSFMPYRNSLYNNLCSLVRQETIASSDHKEMIRIREILQRASESLASLNDLTALSRSHQFRAQLMELCTSLEILDSSSVRQALQSDEEHIFLLLQQIVSTKDSSIRKGVLSLKENDAENFMDLLQTTLDKYSNDSARRGARRLLVKLSEASGIIPTSLMIRGVDLLEKDAVFGGGFADIYKASYQDKEVALKRMRVFQRGPERHRIHRTFCKEALIWQSLRHPHVLPFLGVDSDTFTPYFCMVSPWMQRGTIMRHLSENQSVDVMKLLREVTRGLDYLHSQKIIHGDLRGGNILINDDWQACLADFGLTVVSDTTLATQTSNSHGSVRWMAPELHDPEAFGFIRFLRTSASDIYAFGCVCLEVYTGRIPFTDVANDSTVMLQVLRSVRPQRPPPDTGRYMPDDVWHLIERCWAQNPSERLDIQSIIDATEQWESRK